MWLFLVKILKCDFFPHLIAWIPVSSTLRPPPSGIMETSVKLFVLNPPTFISYPPSPVRIQSGLSEHVHLCFLSWLCLECHFSTLMLIKISTSSSKPFKFHLLLESSFYCPSPMNPSTPKTFYFLRERTINLLPVASLSVPWLGMEFATQAYVLTRNRTGDLLLCGMMPNQLSHMGQGYS